RPQAAARASGVTSSGVPPRPPVTTTRSARSACSRSVVAISSISSGTTAIRRTSTPAASSRRASQLPFVFSTSPERSSLPIVTIAADAIVGQYCLVQIRPFEAADAPAAAELVQPLQPGILVTPAYLAHRERAEPERARRSSWLAVENGDALGFGTSAVKWDEPGAVGRFWIGVRPDRRNRGIGAALYDLAERHARAVGVRRLTVEVDDDPDGLRFVEARGFERVTAEIVSSLDPQLADLGELDALLAE